VRGRPATTVIVTALAVSSAFLLGAARLPGSNRGYEPNQPIAFSHRLHVSDLEIGCAYCHTGAEISRHAGIPPMNVCMNCHRFVTGASRGGESAAAPEAGATEGKPQAEISPELRKLYDALARDEKLALVPGRTAQAVRWVKVHNLPDFVFFDHRSHVSVGVACQQCHGPVDTMDRIRQVAPLSMGWCVNCHRDASESGIAGKAVNAPTNCSTCHY